MAYAADTNEDMYSNLDEISAPEPVQNLDDSHDTSGSVSNTMTREDDDGYENLDELADPAPDQNPEERGTYRHSNLEDEREGQHNSSGDRSALNSTKSNQSSSSTLGQSTPTTSRWFTEFTVWSYLVLFSILGTLARLGLQALTRYPGAPVPNTELWANVGGSFVMGYIREDRLLFRKHWANANTSHESSSTREKHSADQDQGKTVESFMAAKATVPAYIGVTVGFCGSFTSFSSFIRDVFLALSNDLNTASISTMAVTSVPKGRSDGYSVMAVLGVLIMEISLSLGALSFGAHMATFLHPFAGAASSIDLEKHLDGLAIVFGWGSWIGAIIMAILPPDRFGSSVETWRGQVLFALVFAPLGCFARFRLSLWLNGRFKSFPLGTFVANAFGTLILGLCYDLQHVALPDAGGLAGGGLTGCQVLQGIQDGFCGCLTTVSTWGLELKGLRRSHAYFYGTTSVVVSLLTLVVVMGTVRWTIGFAAPACKI